MKRYKYLIASIFFVILVAGYFAPVGSIHVQNDAVRNATTDTYYQLDELQLPDEMTVENTRATTRSIDYDGSFLGTTNMTTYNIVDSNGTSYIKTIATYYPADKSDYGLIIQTPLIPESIFENSTNVNTGSVDTIVENPVRYTWDGNVTFISTKSRPYYVKYDHPDNGPYSNATNEIPPDEADPPTILTGSDGIDIVHIPVHDMNQMKTDNEFGGAGAALLATVLGLLFTPEPVATKVAAAILVIVWATIAFVCSAFNYWLDTYWRSELNDGWTYLGGFGSWSIFQWCWISFGEWRDWHFPVIFIGPGWDSGYDGAQDPFAWNVPFETRCINIWYRPVYDGEGDVANVTVEVKSPSSTATRVEYSDHLLTWGN
ncbi:MAG TPA: hypothetical protein VEH86_01260 [Candidatus Acidoferrum sp.]|nr:hypothetical protein [Candidatus Acidoferrum sp.]